jgi:hypothetical protein
MPKLAPKPSCELHAMVQKFTIRPANVSDPSVNPYNLCNLWLLPDRNRTRPSLSAIMGGPTSTRIADYFPATRRIVSCTQDGPYWRE